MGQREECSLVGAAGCLVCCRLRPTGWTGSPQITRGSVPTPSALKNFILPKKLPGKLQPPGLKSLQWSPAQDCPIGLAAHPFLLHGRYIKWMGIKRQKPMDLPVRGSWSGQSELLGAGSPVGPSPVAAVVHLCGITCWSLLYHPHVAPDPLPALSSASHCPAGRWPWAFLRKLCHLPGIMPLSTGLSPRFLLKEEELPIC